MTLLDHTGILLFSANIHRFSLSYLTPLNETLLVGRFKRFCHIPCFQTLPPRRAPQARGEACVTVFERRSHLGPPAEGRPGPSDDDDDDDDDDNDDDLC